MTQPILIDIPMPITTPRLIIRPTQAGEGAELNASILETFDELRVWMPWADHRPTLDESEESVRRAHARWILREDLRMSIFDRATGKFAGGTGLHRINWSLPAFEIGYWLRKCFVGKGYATEATHALTRFAFGQLQARRVELRCDPRNERSLAVFKRLGFDCEGRLRGNALPAGSGVPGSGVNETRDTLVYSRLGIEGLPELEVSW